LLSFLLHYNAYCGWHKLSCCIFFLVAFVLVCICAIYIKFSYFLYINSHCVQNNFVWKVVFQQLFSISMFITMFVIICLRSCVFNVCGQLYMCAKKWKSKWLCVCVCVCESELLNLCLCDYVGDFVCMCVDEGDFILCIHLFIFSFFYNGNICIIFSQSIIWTCIAFTWPHSNFNI